MASATPDRTKPIYDQDGNVTKVWHEGVIYLLGTCHYCKKEIKCLGRDAEWYHSETRLGGCYP